MMEAPDPLRLLASTSDALSVLARATSEEKSPRKSKSGRKIVVTSSGTLNIKTSTYNYFKSKFAQSNPRPKAKAELAEWETKFNAWLPGALKRRRDATTMHLDRA